MSMTTPPGWYPDPTHQGPGPAPERWWDGAAWTDYRRDASAGQQPAPPFGAPGPADPSFSPPPPGHLPGGFPTYPPGSGDAPRGRGPKIAALVVAAGVLVAAIVGGFVLLQDDDDDKGEAKPKTSATVPAPGPSTGQDDGGGRGDGGTGGASPTTPPSVPPTTPPGIPPTDDPRAAEDIVSGISLPVLDGWRAGSNSTGGASVVTSSYPCPGAPEINCVRGGAFSYTATGYKASTAEGIAKEDIAENAENAYGTDSRTKQKPYGGITSHKQLKAQAVTVAGQKGYLVRWKVATKKGDDGYVQSLAFPSPIVSEAMVVVRFGFDVSDKAPSLADMDKIVKGIKPLGGSEDSETV